MIKKEWTHGRFRTIFSWRDPGGFGRFGGGWNWKIGVQWGRTAVIFSVLVFEVSFRWHKPKITAQ